MGTLTIRTNAVEDAAIEELKALFGEASASKAILRAVTSYKKLKESDEDFSRRLKRAEEKLDIVKYNYSAMMRHKEVVEVELGVNHKG